MLLHEDTVSHEKKNDEEINMCNSMKQLKRLSSRRQIVTPSMVLLAHHTHLANQLESKQLFYQSPKW